MKNEEDLKFGNWILENFSLKEDALETVADILVEEFPDRYNIRYTREFNGKTSIEVPNVI